MARMVGRRPALPQAGLCRHAPRARAADALGQTFTFVTDGIESALAQAREAAGDKDVFIGGGADIINQFLAAGLVDEIELHVVPIILGGGERLFAGVGPDVKLEQVRVVEAPGVTHLKYRVVK
jgi:dihydrofolate reductase